MKKVACGLVAVLAGMLGASAFAFEVPQFTAGEVAVPAAAPVQTDVSTAQTLRMMFADAAKAQDVMGKVTEYLGLRVQSKEIVDKGFGQFELLVKYTGSPLSVWLAVYNREDARKGLYHMGPVLEDAKVQEMELKGQQALKEIVEYLQSGRDSMFFGRPKVPVVYSSVTLGRVGGHSDRGGKIEIVSPCPMLILDGILPDGMISHLNKNGYRPIPSATPGQ